MQTERSREPVPEVDDRGPLSRFDLRAVEPSKGTGLNGNYAGT